VRRRVLVGLGIGATVLAYLALRPHISVSDPMQMDPDRPLYAAFEVQNDGEFDFCDVQCAFLVRKLDNTMGITFADNAVASAQMYAARLPPEGRFTFSVERMFEVPVGFIKNAEVEVVIIGQPQYVPWWRVVRRAAFYTHWPARGGFRWFAMAPRGDLPKGFLDKMEMSRRRRFMPGR
jgi:hypothetical protein